MSVTARVEPAVEIQVREVPDVLAVVGGRAVREVMGSVSGVGSSFGVWGVCDWDGRVCAKGDVVEEDGARRS